MRIINQLSVGKKVATGNFIVILLASISGFYSLLILKESRKIDDRLTENYYPLIDALEDFDKITSTTQTLCTNWLYLPNEQDKSDLRKIREEQYPELIASLYKKIQDWPTDELDSITYYILSYDRTIEHQNRMMNDLNTSEAYQDDLLLFDLIPLLDDEILSILDDVSSGIVGQIQKLEIESELLVHQKYSSFDSLEIKIISLTLLAIVLGILLIWVVVKSIMNTLGGEPAEVAFIANQIAQGKLDVSFNKSRLVGLYASIKVMAEKLSNIVGEVYAGANSITQASMQMSTSSQQVSSGASDQAASSEEVSASMEEMVANIQNNSESSQKAEEVSLRAMRNVEEGKNAVDNTVISMRSIAEKVSVIGEMARQTNILALNAAVEAARAGQAGKGFAVVAAEVRRLAENSQASATEIDDMCRSSVDVAEGAGQLFKDLVPTIQETVELVQEINNSSREQNAGAEQVNGAIQQLNSITQQNAASSEEMAASSEELLSQADQLKDTMSFFNIVTKTNSEKVTSARVKPVNIPIDKYLPNSLRKQNGISIDLELEVNDNDFERFN